MSSEKSADRYPPQLVDALKRALEANPDVPTNAVAQVSSSVFGETKIVLDEGDDR